MSASSSIGGSSSSVCAHSIALCALQQLLLHCRLAMQTALQSSTLLEAAWRMLL